MQPFNFIVAFEVPAGREADFRQEFFDIAARIQQSPGGTGGSGALYEVSSEVESYLMGVPEISAALQARPDARATFRFVLIAEWESLPQYEAAVRASSQGKPISFPAHPAYFHVAAEYLGAADQDKQPSQGFTFINPIEVPTGKEAEFRQEWHSTVERLISAPGFLASRLYEVDAAVEAHLLSVPGISAALQRRLNGKARFPFVWVSQWASVSQYESAVRTFGRGKPISFPCHPAFYRPANK